MALTDAPTNLFWSGIALAVMMMLISFILNIIAAVREANRSRQTCHNRLLRPQGARSSASGFMHGVANRLKDHLGEFSR